MLEAFSSASVIKPIARGSTSFFVNPELVDLFELLAKAHQPKNVTKNVELLEITVSHWRDRQKTIFR
jgi:hypothetical protein